MAGCSAKCYFMADLNYSAGKSQKENLHLQFPDDSFYRRKPVEHATVRWFGELQLSSFILEAFWGSEDQCAFRCSWGTLIDDHFWTKSCLLLKEESPTPSLLVTETV